MPGLTERKIEIVRSLMEVSPDRVVGALREALASTSGDDAMADVRRLVEAEAKDRRLRSIALEPAAALFVADGRATDRLTFPAAALALIWKGLKAQAPDQVEMLGLRVDDVWSDGSPTEIQDLLAEMVAQSLRSGSPQMFAQAAALCDQARPGGADLAVSCFELCPGVRRAAAKLGDWIVRRTAENATAARLAYKDAVAVAEDAGGRFFELLSTQLPQPWMILRIISAVMDRPAERFMAQTEFAPFAERLMDAIDQGLAEFARFDVDGGAAAGVAAAKAVELATTQITELEEAIELSREGPWGKRVAKQRQGIAAGVERRLKDAEKAVWVALPTQSTRVQKLTKRTPSLVGEPDANAVRRAVGLLTFANEIRSSANRGGFAAAETKLAQALDDDLEAYIEDVLEVLRHDDGEAAPAAQHHLAVVAEFVRLIHDRKAAELVRRRAAAAAAVAEKAATAA